MSPKRASSRSRGGSSEKKQQLLGFSQALKIPVADLLGTGEWIAAGVVVNDVTPSGGSPQSLMYLRVRLSSHLDASPCAPNGVNHLDFTTKLVAKGWEREVICAHAKRDDGAG